MAQCPKCGKKLRLHQWRPECPFCGVNMVYYDSNGRLLKETEQTEIEHAKSQPRIDRMKAATIGSPQAIIRIILSVLPLGALFLPLGVLFSGTIKINAVTIYKYLDRMGAEAIWNGFVSFKLPEFPAMLIVITVLLIAIHLLCLITSLGIWGKIRSLILDLLMIINFLCAVYLVSLKPKEGTMIKWGTYVCIGCFVVLLIYDIVLAFVGLPVKYTPCYIGGLPSEEYFALVKSGVSELEIRKKMMEALTSMQEEVFRKVAQEHAAEEEKRAAQG